MKTIFLLIIISLHTVMAVSCTCAFTGNAQEEVKKHDFVFIGKVISKTWIKSEDGNHFIVKVKQKEIFKGKIQTKIISVKTGPSLPGCGFPFEVGKTYAIYAFSTQNEIRTSQCTRNTKKWRKEKKMIKVGLQQPV